MHVILSNFGNDSFALIQWAHEQQLNNAQVIYVDTGWAAPCWINQIEQGKAWVQGLGFKMTILQPKANFADLMRTRGGFPSQKFQWCAGFLKALPINAWLEQNDTNENATILVARRRAASRSQVHLPEFITESEHFGDRKVWHPLYLHTHQDRDDLLNRAGFPVLTHRSLECDPCVNSNLDDVLRMDRLVLSRTSALELELNSKLLDPSLYNSQTDLASAVATQKAHPSLPSNHYELFEMGCGSVYGCGL